MKLTDILDSFQKNNDNMSVFKTNFTHGIKKYIMAVTGNNVTASERYESQIDLGFDSDSSREILIFAERRFEFEYLNNSLEGLRVWLYTPYSGKEVLILRINISPDGKVLIHDHEVEFTIDDFEGYSKLIMDTIVKFITDNPFR